MSPITLISRLIVGILFIFSGLIKANDPLGFSYKLAEYFEVFEMHFLVAAALPLAVFICVFEVIVGVALLIGARTKLTLWLLLLMILFFTFLTFYSAFFNKVTSCGCFGDAIPLTPWQSFGKDVVLSILILLLFKKRKEISQLLPDGLEKSSLLLTIIAATAFPIYTFNYLPVKDFRPYKVGTDLYAAIHPQVKYFYLLKNKETGEQEEFDAWPPNWDKEWDYVENRTVPLDESVTPIVGFAMFNEYNEDYTDEFLQKEGYKFLLVEYNLDKANEEIQGKINDFATMCENENIEFVALTSSDSLKVEKFKKNHSIHYPFYINLDDVPLKTMIRSNPGLVLFKGSKVIAKWHYHSIPSFSDVKTLYIQNNKE